MKRNSGSFGASLIELIVAVALFAIVAAQCVQIFFAATELSYESANLSRAVIIAESVADARAFGGYSEYYDSDGQPLEDAAGAEYIVSVESDGGIASKITVSTAAGEEIYSIRAAERGPQS